jgi:DNA-directed RNA polymerase subunit RPC12/RpoP
MTKNDIIGHWYKCKECGKEFPISDDKFRDEDVKLLVSKEFFCPSCKKVQELTLSDAEKPCSEKEGLSYWKRDELIKEGKERITSYWKKIGNRHRTNKTP